MTTYTKKHYEQIARIISESDQPKAKDYLARRFAVVFTRDNDRFNADKWFEAVGVQR